ncbi:MAG: ArsC/Spx/MgsR family protein [Breznakibacter sp.]
MKHVYYLDNCSTCRKVIEEVGLDHRFTFQNLKQMPILASQLDWLATKVGSYGRLLNKQSRKYKEMGLAGKELSESEIRDLILQEYTFLKRPVVIVEDNVFVCRDKKTIAELIHTMKVKG